MKKILSMVRMLSFIVTLLTTIPLFIVYLKGVEPAHELIVHLHVWFGLAFFIAALSGMIIQQINKKQNDEK